MNGKSKYKNKIVKNYKNTRLTNSWKIKSKKLYNNVS